MTARTGEMRFVPLGEIEDGELYHIGSITVVDHGGRETVVYRKGAIVVHRRGAPWSWSRTFDAMVVFRALVRHGLARTAAHADVEAMSGVTRRNIERYDAETRLKVLNTEVEDNIARAIIDHNHWDEQGIPLPQALTPARSKRLR